MKIQVSKTNTRSEVGGAETHSMTQKLLKMNGLQKLEIKE